MNSFYLTKITNCNITHYKRFSVLPNLRKQISLISLLSILKISQPEHGLCFMMVILYGLPLGQMA
jgi:hypothetical protein